MASTDEQVIFEVIVKNDDALKRIKENKEDIAELREAQALLNKRTQEGREEWEKYDKEIKTLRKENALLTKEIRDNNKSIQDQEGSIKSMRSELSLLNKAYVNLSQAERESAKGRELQEKILSLNTTIGDAEKKLGDFRRQVGNYENSITNALGANNKYVATLVAMKDGNMNLSSALKVATTSVVSFGKALYAAILANPIVAVIAGVVAALTGLYKIMRGNEEQAARLDAVLAPFKRTLEGIIAVLQVVAGFVLDLAEGFESLTFGITKLAEKIPVVGKYFKQSNDAMLASIQLAKDKAALDKQTRELEVANAKAQYDVAELRKKAEDKSKYTAEERLKFVQEANAKEQEILDNQLRIAEERLRIAQEEASYNKSSKDVLDNLAKAEADYYNILKTNSDRTRELITKENEIRNQSVSDEKARLDQVKKASEEAANRKQKELELIRQAEDAAFALVKEGAEKQRQAINTEYDRQIASLKTRLATEKDLTVAAKEALNSTIISLEEQRIKKLNDLNDKALQDQIKKETARIQLQLDAVKEGTSQEHDLRLQLIEQNRQAELTANMQLTEELRQSEADINAKYNKQLSDENEAFRKEQYDKQVEMLRLEWDNRLLQVRKGSMEELNLKVQQAQAEYDALVNMDAETKARLYESDAAYTNAVLQSKRNITDAEKAVITAENEAAMAQLEAASTITDAFSSMIDAFAEDNEALAEFAKTIAIFNIGISTAAAIAKGVEAAQSVPFPGNIVAVATTIATIMANIAKAKQLLSKEKTPKYADGGDIVGDSHANGGVLIEAEGGEAVINKTSMSNPLLRSIASAVNVAGGGVPFAGAVKALDIFDLGQQVSNQEAMKQAFTEALREMPSPVVSVVEFSEVQNRVKMIEHNASL